MAIRVVVRKRPLSRKELAAADRDVMEMGRRRGEVLIHEPKTKVDLTKVIETQAFVFDDAFDCEETNELIYLRTVAPLVAFVFEGGKASCFAYGQTGSGKTFSMMGSRPDAPAEAEVNAGLYVAEPSYRHLRVFVSCFEIYGGKLFDLLNDRGLVKCLEDAKQQVQLPGLTEHLVGDVPALLQLMAMAHGARSTGSTGANSESSRSHQIMQIVLREPETQPLRSRARVVQAPTPGLIVGKLSFIDLAGSERGADTTHNSKQTRMEGAEINTSLLALKEVIRSLERKHGHTPFRGSKLTQVLKDSFVGERTRTCMVACVSPSHSNCEHTLNTLRYAYNLVI
ncbi:P-loop containing nucleoside triphosphate hydrolase protein [Ochromonadaceae sp. CCMP2298]|nr:P-loop containing nucleoside triphosphate hydrolase protein [Ochromonadaceae sp. CCMP2298]